LTREATCILSFRLCRTRSAFLFKQNKQDECAGIPDRARYVRCGLFRKGASLTFPRTYIISATVMSALRSNYWRLALLPVLLAASLLLPTLHLHSVHDHDGHSHQHAIIHADFLSVSAQVHRYLQQRAAALGDSSPWAFPQTGLSALLVRGVDSLLTGLEKSLKPWTSWSVMCSPSGSFHNIAMLWMATKAARWITKGCNKF
jgi:hypothetical protein